MNLTRNEILARTVGVGEGGAEWDVVARLLAERYSCRAFLAKPAPRETIERILSLAQLSATWCNAQPWQVIVTEGEATEKLRTALIAHAKADPAPSVPDIPFPVRYEGIYGERRREAGWALYDQVGVSRGDRSASARQMLENYRLFGAPHLLLLTSEADLGPYGLIDCGIFLANLMLLMQSVGIASIAQGALARFAPFLRDHFAIPAHRTIVAGVSFGYPDVDHPANGFRTRRAALDAVVQWVAN